MGYDLDLFIFGSSRPMLFPYCWESVKKYCCFRGNLRAVFHEDVVFPDLSEKTIEVIQHLVNKKELHGYDVHNPCIGLGPAMTFMLPKVDTKYLFYLQEDWEFERPIDIDRILWTMDNHEEINCIFFNKTKNYGSLNGSSQPQFTFDGLNVCLYHSWPFLPGIWRMDHIRRFWEGSPIRPEGNFTNKFGNHKRREDVEYCRTKLGVYMLGESGAPRYSRHIGNDWRTAKWRLENGNFGGLHDAERMDYPHMAPWISELPDRPVFDPKKKAQLT